MSVKHVGGRNSTDLLQLWVDDKKAVFSLGAGIEVVLVRDFGWEELVGRGVHDLRHDRA